MSAFTAKTKTALRSKVSGLLATALIGVNLVVTGCAGLVGANNGNGGPKDAPAIVQTSVANITHNSVQVQWTTNIAATSQVDYGTSTTYGSSTVLDPTMVTSHSVSLGALSAKQAYHFRVVSAANGQQASSADQTFTTSSGVASISGITPTSGNTTGGTQVTISGSDLVSGATVQFGGSAGTSVTFVSDTQIKATTPAHAAGAVTVTVTNPSTTASAPFSSFTYTAANSPLAVTTTSLPSGAVNSAYSATLQASGGKTPYSWSISSGTLPSGLTLSATGAISGAAKAAGTSSVTFQVKDAVNATAPKVLSIQIGAAAQPPAVSTTSLPAGTVGSAYSSALQATGGKTPYVWSLSTGSLPAGLTLSSAGAISGSPTTSATSSFTVQVKDASNLTGTKALSIAVSTSSTPASVSTSSLAAGTVGKAYSATLQGAGGKTPYTWALSNGSLPAGLTLSSAGVISGTPTVAGTSPFTVQIKDALNQTATKALSLVVNSATQQALTITSTLLPQASTNVAYSVTLTATGGTPSYSWSITSGALPSGMTLGASTGLISGTASSAGTSTFTVQVTDSASTPATKSATTSITVVTGVALDQFGGRMDLNCSTTGKWSVEKIGSEWWMCTPAGHGLFVQDVEYIQNTDSTASNKASAKYGSNNNWAEATLKRLNAWGFNTVGVYSYNYLYPVTVDTAFPVDSNGIHSHTIKFPFVSSVRPSFYSMRNHVVQQWTGGTTTFLTDPVKNIFGAVSPFYNSYVPLGGIGDYYDGKMQTWLNQDLANDWGYGYIKNGPYNDYQIGFVGDDGDQTYGFNTGPSFPTVPKGQNNSFLSLIVLSGSPIQTANSRLGYVYVDPTMFTKQALHDALVAKYGSIGALNSAWGSDYTTFDSSGTCVGAQPIGCASSSAANNVGSGNGTTTTFTAALIHTVVSARSVSIYVAGTRVSGDLGDGNLYGPDVSSGKINYATGALSITFKTAPASGSAITAGYVANGWGIGTGLMDEDMRAAHRQWLGNTWEGLYAIPGAPLTQMSSGVQTDLDTYLEQTAGWYFKMLHDGVKAHFPNGVVMMGLGGWSGMPPAPVLRAAGNNLDLIELDETGALFDPARLDYVVQSYGDRPFLANLFFSANPDSSLAGNPNPVSGAFQTQALKGQGYATALKGMLAAKTSSGVNPHVGVILWSWMDMWGELKNWGLVSHLDNAYDGHDSSSGSVACSAPLQQYTCGGEPGNYGDYISGVKTGNKIWLTH